MKSVSKTTVQCIDCEHIGKPKNISAGDLQMVQFGFGICENSENKSWFSLLYNRDCDKFKISNEGDKRRAWLNQNSEDRDEAIERGSGKT